MNSVAVTASGSAVVCAESTHIQTDEEKYSILVYSIKKALYVRIVVAADCA